MTQFFSLPYHQPAFIHLSKIFQDEIRHVLIHKYAALRRRRFLEQFKPNEVIESEAAWNRAKEILDSFDSEMRSLISGRSVAYWLHIYRRIGVFLSPEHEDKTDHITTGLVRQIAELAIQKHGLRVAPQEFGLTDKLGPDVILGGWMKKGLKSLGTKEQSGERIYREYSRHLRKISNWVIRDFSKKDFTNIYAIEGASYQYWKLTALLRSLGKGAKIIVNETGDWNYAPNYTLNQLLVSIDTRNKRRSTFSSLMGVWIDTETIMESKDDDGKGSESDIVFFPTYNISRVEMPRELQMFGVPFPEKSVPNFLPLYLRANKFFESHGFMREEFFKRRGYDFELLVSVLAGASSFLFLPSRALYTDDQAERERIKLSAFMQTLTRGYHLFVGSEEDLLETLLERMSIIFSKQFDRNEVRGVLSSITLAGDIQKKISPWSNGPRCIVIPAGGVYLIDLVSVPAMLRSIFAFMTDRFGTSGTVFERLFKEALERRGFKVESGRLVAHDGSERELDAGVVVGGRMYLFECVSIERPLDYEISRPSTMAVRQKRLTKKLDQARSLHAFLSKNPSGRNYDFSSSKEFVWAVVSPFVEWIWDAGSELWLDRSTPRILAPEEAFSLLGCDGR